MRETRRRSLRHRLTLPAAIYAQDGELVAECRTWDFSEDGARLEVMVSANLPSVFTLKLSSDESRQCEVIWRSEKHVGVRFQADWRLAPSPPANNG
jgi:hypothetical protein